MKNTILISGASSHLAFKTITNFSKKNNLVCITSKKEKLSQKLKKFNPIIINDQKSDFEEIVYTLEKKG